MGTHSSVTALGVFARDPVPGQVKTRLAAAWGSERAAELYAAFVADTVDRFCTTANRRYLCYTPAGRESAGCFAELSGGEFDLWPQPDAPLGERLEAFFRMAFAAGAQRVVVLGSDSPTLPREYVERAFDLLGDNVTQAESAPDKSRPGDCATRIGCVLGPTTDGGYYLVGLRDGLVPIFSGIDWSTPRVLVQTVARLRQVGASLALLPVWYDIDEAEDVVFLRGHLEALEYAGEAVPTRTAARLATTDGRLEPFASKFAEEVLSWVRTPDEARQWANLDGVPVDASIFGRWHAEPGVRPFLLLADGAPVGYGEVWLDPLEPEAELGRLLVKPCCRGRGIGRRLVRLLVEQARATRSGPHTVFVRVFPGNAAALACYERAGLRQVAAADRRRYNRDQAIEYVWFESADKASIR